MIPATAADILVFAGGYVDIYDMTTNRCTTASLKGRCHNVAAATVGDKIFFAGGRTGDYVDSDSNKIDIYNLTTPGQKQ